MFGVFTILTVLLSIGFVITSADGSRPPRTLLLILVAVFTYSWGGIYINLIHPIADVSAFLEYDEYKAKAEKRIHLLEERLGFSGGEPTGRRDMNR
jgi:hypothetical protein